LTTGNYEEGRSTAPASETPGSDGPLEPSGERFYPGTGTPENSYEHWHRYLWARELCRGKRVLDVASGEGYGSFLLAGVARSVVGVDLSGPAVEHARQCYAAENLEFRAGRAEALPDLGPSSFDVVVSFETIEHLTEAAQPRFLSEVRRVLAPGGLFIVSTPDKETYANELHEENEFHEREFTPDEFRALLLTEFSHVRFFGQRTFPVSYLWPMDPGPDVQGLDEHQLARKEPRTLGPADGDQKRALYVVALCSDSPVQRSRSSLLLDTAQLAIRERIEEAVANRWHLEQAQGQLDESARRNEELARRNEELARRNEDLTGGLQMATQRAERAEVGLADANERVTQVERIRGIELKRAELRDTELATTRARLVEAEEGRHHADQRWDEFQRSRAASVVRRIQAARARVAPSGSVAGRLIELGFRGAALAARQGVRGTVARLVGNAASEEGLFYSLDRLLPERLDIGGGTELRVSGWCYHREDEIVALEFILGGRRVPVTVFRMKRPDVFEDRAQVDPDAQSLFSGFDGLLPLRGPVPRSVEVELRVRLRRGTRFWRKLGTIQLEAGQTSPVQNEAEIAICMATYEPSPDLFLKQVRSLQAQTVQTWVCIICDDRSSRRSRNLIRSVIADDPRFVLVENDENVGFYRNFERALARVPVAARFVLFSDQDDVWYPEKIASLLQELSSGASLAYGDMRIVATDGRELAPSYWVGRDNNFTSFTSMLLANTVTGAAAMFRRELLEPLLPFPERIGESYHDHWLAVTAMSTGTIGHVARPLQDYVQHQGNVLGHFVGTGARTRFRELMRESLAVARGGPARGPVLAAWEGIYRADVMRIAQFARVLEVRNAPRMGSEQRRALRRFARLDQPARSLPWLLARGAYRGLRGYNETVGAEFYVAKGLLWKALTAVRARRARRHAPSLPPREPARAEAASAVHIIDDIERKIAPLNLEVRSGEPERINLLVPSVDLVHFFGGYITKFNLALKLAKEGWAVRIATVDPSPTLPADWRTQLARFQGLRDFFDEVELVHAGDRGRPLPVSPTDAFVATTFWTALIAASAVRELGGPSFTYLIQEYEPFTFPMGSWSALAEQSYQAPHYAVFSSELLRDYFRQNRIGVFSGPDGEARSTSFQNAITDVGPVGREELACRTSHRLLFYARPEAHAARNMFEMGIVALSEAIRRGIFSEEWEFYGIGTVAAGTELPLAEGKVLRLLPRQSQGRYAEVLVSHDVGLSLMYTPHPSLVPIEMAAAGMTVVTNAFANKTEAALREISANLLAVPPTIPGVVAGLKRAVGRTEDVDARAAGSHVRWSKDWNQSFGPEQILIIGRFVTQSRPVRSSS
jgi:SAM-dependent methyltransferase